MSNYQLQRLEKKVRDALESVSKVLGTNRNPVLPSDCPHQYQDKYILAEFATKAGAAAVLNSLKQLGFDDDKIGKIIGWIKENRTVTLSLVAEEHCAFDRTEEREVESPTKIVTEQTSGALSALVGKKTTKVVTTVTEHFWRFSITWSLTAYAGANPDDKIVLLIFTILARIMLGLVGTGFSAAMNAGKIRVSEPPFVSRISSMIATLFLSFVLAILMLAMIALTAEHLLHTMLDMADWVEDQLAHLPLTGRWRSGVRLAVSDDKILLLFFTIIARILIAIVATGFTASWRSMTGGKTETIKVPA